jgi:hypothetical protein
MHDERQIEKRVQVRCAKGSGSVRFPAQRSIWKLRTTERGEAHRNASLASRSKGYRWDQDKLIAALS